MIRAVLCLSLLFLCLAPEPAGAEGFWIFGKKKKEESAAVAQDRKVFNATGGEKDSGKKSFMSKILGGPEKKVPDVKVNGVTVKGLRPEMMLSSYIPKTPEEIMLISYVHKSWEGDAMVARQAQANQRIAASLQQSEADLKKMRAASAKEMEKAMAERAKAQAAHPANAATGPAKGEKRIFNKSGLKKPAKVFKDYR